MHTSPFGKTATISATISAQSSILLLAHWVLSVRSAVVLMADGLRTVRVPHLTLEHHLGRVQWIVVRERDGRCEETSLVRRIRRAPCKQQAQSFVVSYSFSWQGSHWLAGRQAHASSTYMMYASHSKKLSSDTGPAVMPSVGFVVSSAHDATDITQSRMGCVNRGLIGVEGLGREYLCTLA